MRQIATRYSRHKILLVTQTASMIQALLLAALILFNHYVIWEILALSVILGVVNAFDTPARQPMVHDMVNYKEDISNALALNSAMVNIAKLIGPALSGIVLHAFGAGICFSLNALSFVAVLASLILMKFPKFNPPTIKKSAISELADGFRYLKDTPSISLVLAIIIFLSLFVIPYDTLVPIFAKEVFKGNAVTFGYLSSFIGLGAVLGSLFLASLKKETNLKIVLLISVVILGIGMILFSFMNTFIMSLPFAIIIGFASLMPMTASITIIQLEAASNMRGRVMSFIAMAYFGMLPLGSLLVGAVSQKITAPVTMLLQGIMALLIAMLFSRIIKKNTPAVKEV